MSYTQVQKYFVILGEASISSRAAPLVPLSMLYMTDVNGLPVEYDTELDALLALQTQLTADIAATNKQNGPVHWGGFVTMGYKIVYA